MDPATLSLIINLGVKMATAEMERRAGKRLAEMNAEEALTTVNAATAAFHAKTMAEMEAEVAAGGAPV